MSASATPRLILASASPRRAELLRQIGLQFEQKPVDLDESVLPGESPACYVKRLALAKANAAAALLEKAGNFLVIGSDTSVVYGGKVFGKPNSKSEFFEMLESLSDRQHEVLTAVALVKADGTAASELVTTQVRFRALSRWELEAYWHTGEPCDKAGGYGIQGRGAVFVKQIKGSYSAVMGLPIYETADLLAKAGVDVWHAAGE